MGWGAPAIGDGKKPDRSDGECGSRRLEAGQAICPHQREQETWCREVGRAEVGQGAREETLLGAVWSVEGSRSLQSVTGSSCWDEIRGKTLRACILQEMRCQAGDSVMERQHDILESGSIAHYTSF